ncbi:clathrin, heavy chain [Kipferlia bialata]|uniref:Clathrin heavy chain n=1 Tax=Kipferlia bialata TaxID=797122 RepID=A0A391NP90_9EUKA|nr:clathrin, heavy chain [Kipferlia bialata]|eukprot:g1617.t1
MASSSILDFETVNDLVAHGLSESSFKFASLSISSEKYACVRDESGEKPRLVLVDIESDSVSSFNMSAESAIMHPSKKVVAVRAGSQMQVVDLGAKKHLANQTLTESVVFWRFLDETNLVVVTETAVYHWDIEAKFERLFSRDSKLQGAKITSYDVSADKQWSLLTGISVVEGVVTGHTQLHSMAAKRSQVIPGHAAAFTTWQKAPGMPEATIVALGCQISGTTQLRLLEIGGQKNPDGSSTSGFQKSAVTLQMQPGQMDFPLFVVCAHKYGLTYMVTKLGILYVHEVTAGTLLYRGRVPGLSSDQSFLFALAPVGVPAVGFVGASSEGKIVRVVVNEQTVVPYVLRRLGNQDCALRLAAKAGLQGANELFVSQFERHFSSGNYNEAIDAVLGAPPTVLRNRNTLQRFRSAPDQTATFRYFHKLMETSALEDYESVELARLILQQGKKELLKRFIDENRLTGSEALGDICMQAGLEMEACKIYVQGGAHEKAVIFMAAQGEFDKVFEYSRRVNYQPDLKRILERVVERSPTQGAELAHRILFGEDEAQVSLDDVVEVFVSRGLSKEATGVLLQVCKQHEFDESTADIQTKILEVNIKSQPEVANAIISKRRLVHFDRKLIAEMCEEAQLFERALELYSAPADLVRVAVNTSHIGIEFFETWAGTQEPEAVVAVCKEMLAVNTTANLNHVIKACIKLGANSSAEIMRMFLKYDSQEALFYYLGSIVDLSEEPEVHYRYLEACSYTGNTRELERICRESQFLEGDRARDFLLDASLPDLAPLTIVCDRFGYVAELVQHLLRTHQNKAVHSYCTRFSPQKTPQVVAALLDYGAEDAFVRELCLDVRTLCDVPELVKVTQERHRLKLLKPMLERRRDEGATDEGTHTGILMVLAEENDPSLEAMLESNKYYSHADVGRYCERRDPHLAFLAFRTDPSCSEDMVRVANEHSLFKQLSRELVRRKDFGLWAQCLSEENENRSSLIDQVIAVALPSSESSEQISATVKAFIDANIPDRLIELLEQIVLHPGSEFAANGSLQSLLIITVIKSDKEKVMPYIKRLDAYDGPVIAGIAVKTGLYEEAFCIYQKFNKHAEAVNVMLQHLGMERAQEYAETVNLPEVWTQIAQAMLAVPDVEAAITCFIKGENSDSHAAVIAAAHEANAYEALIPYLRMCRSRVKDSGVDTEYAFTLARLNRLADLEELLVSPNLARVQQIGDRCLSEEMYEAARILFQSISNFADLTTCLLKIGDHRAAVDAARRASSLRSWIEVNKACVEVEEFRLARLAGLHIVVNADELPRLISFYEQRGHVNELMELLEGSLEHERAHVGVYTELGVLYAKFRPESLMGLIQTHGADCNLAILIKTVQKCHLWSELVVLYIAYEEWDSAVATMIERSGVAFDHGKIKTCLAHIASRDLLYRVFGFYLSTQPSLTLDLLPAAEAQLDPSQLVSLARSSDSLFLLKPYLLQIVDKDVPAVNEALTDLYIAEGDFEALAQHVRDHTSFEQIALARRLERHDLVFFRRIAVDLYSQNKRYASAIELSIRDGLFQDAMGTARQSGDAAIAEKLLCTFVEDPLEVVPAERLAGVRKECFSACLMSCFDLIAPETAIELAWRHGLSDYAMPFIIRYLGNMHRTIGVLQKDLQDRQAAAKEAVAPEAPGASPAPEAQDEWNTFEGETQAPAEDWTTQDGQADGFGGAFV